MVNSGYIVDDTGISMDILSGNNRTMNVGITMSQNHPRLGMVNIPTVYGDSGDGLSLLYPHG